MNVSDERFAQLYPPGKLEEEHRREILQAAERGEISLADVRDMIESAGSAGPFAESRRSASHLSRLARS